MTKTDGDKLRAMEVELAVIERQYDQTSDLVASLKAVRSAIDATLRGEDFYLIRCDQP